MHNYNHDKQHESLVEGCYSHASTGIQARASGDGKQIQRYAVFTVRGTTLENGIMGWKGMAARNRAMMR